MSKKNTTVLEVKVTTPSVKTTDVNDVRKMCQKIGDSLSGTYANTGDIKAAAGAVSAYGTAISAVKAQLIYKKMTSSPARIEFFETDK